MSELFEAIERGDIAALRAALDADPASLYARRPPYAHTLLHAAAQAGEADMVQLLLARGLGPDVREEGDRTFPLHWAAAGGHLEVVRALVDAGGDVHGHGDDHELDVIGWATCWDGADGEAHRAVAEFLVSRGARHHIFSAIALGLSDVVREIVQRDPSAINRRMSRNESHQMPLHFAARRDRADMVALLLALGADPLATDSEGCDVAVYAASPHVDRPVMERLRAITLAELDSARRGFREPSISTRDLVALLALHDFENAARIAEGLRDKGALHIMAKRGDAEGARWLLANGAHPDTRWMHYGASVTAMHMVAFSGNLEVARALLDAGADPSLRDTTHDGDALGWAEHFGRDDIARLLRERAGVS